MVAARRILPVRVLGLWIVLAGPLAAQAPTLTDQSLPNSRVLFIGVAPVSSQVAWLSGSRGTWARTLDGGRTWQTGVAGADTLQFRDVHAVDANTAWLLSIGNGEESRIYHTRDGGQTWAEQFRNTEPKAFYDCFAFWDPRRAVVVSDAVDGRMIMRRTEDGGATWNLVQGLPSAAEGEGHFAASGTCLITRGDRHAWFGSGAGRVARVGRTTDGGRTWTVVNTPIIQDTPTAGITTVALFDLRNGLALGGDLARADDYTANAAETTDGGATWRLVGTPTFSGPVYGSAVVPGRGRTIVVVGPKGASWSTSAGRIWQALDNRTYWSVGFGPDGVGWMVGPNGRIIRIEWP
jgi:photosystem II stability/assembly factor-like uncharacterized protein